MNRVAAMLRRRKPIRPVGTTVAVRLTEMQGVQTLRKRFGLRDDFQAVHPGRDVEHCQLRAASMVWC
jgi:hypothetical protein